MNKKEILVTQSSMPEPEEYFDEIRSIWDTKWLTNNGEKHTLLKERLKDYLHVDHIELMVNGHLAIELGIQVFNFPEGSEVITTPFTFTSTTHAIVRNNLKPVFCDVDPDTYTMDPSKIEALITDKTVAIMPVHVYGNVCDVEEIDRIAKKHNLVVLYDAAHTFGEEYKGKGIGTFGDMSYFSFHATKVFNTIEGGCATFKDPKFVKLLNNVKNFGIDPSGEVELVGGNAKMNEFAAAMGLCNLRHVDGEIEKRKRVVECYRENLDDILGIKLNCIQKDVKSNYAYFPVIFDPEVLGFNRDDVFKELGEHHIRARKYFYPNTNTYKCYKDEYNPNDTPIAKKMSENVLTLPLYADLPLEDVVRICDIIKNMMK